MDQKTHNMLKRLALDIMKLKDEADQIQNDVDKIVERVLANEK